MAKVVLFGHADMARMTYSCQSHDSSCEVAAFMADRARIEEDTSFGLPIVAFEDVQTIYPPDEHRMSVPARGELERFRSTPTQQVYAQGLQARVAREVNLVEALAAGGNGRDCIVAHRTAGTSAGPLPPDKDDKRSPSEL